MVNYPLERRDSSLDLCAGTNGARRCAVSVGFDGRWRVEEIVSVKCAGEGRCVTLYLGACAGSTVVSRCVKCVLQTSEALRSLEVGWMATNTHFFFEIELIGVTLANGVYRSQVYDSVTHCLECPPPKDGSSSITMCLIPITLW